MTSNLINNSNLGSESQEIVDALLYLGTLGYNLPVSPGVGASQAQVQAAINAATITTTVASILTALSTQHPVIASGGEGTGTGTPQTITKSGTYVRMYNPAITSVSFTVGTVVITVAPGGTFEGYFASFASISVTATLSALYDWAIGS